MVLVSIGKVADVYGVSTQTIRNWCEEGMFEVLRTKGGHRRFSLEEINEIAGIEKEEQKTIVYSRVSSYDQKEDLKRQTEELKQYCEKQNLETEVIEDIGSGINYKKRGLKKLIQKIVAGKVKKIVVSFRDRLLRFGSELLFQLCELLEVEIIILHDREDKSFEQQLVEDVLTIMIVYSSKIYGKRSHKKRQKLSNNVCNN